MKFLDFVKIPIQLWGFVKFLLAFVKIQIFVKKIFTIVKIQTKNDRYDCETSFLMFIKFSCRFLYKIVNFLITFHFQNSSRHNISNPKHKSSHNPFPSPIFNTLLSWEARQVLTSWRRKLFSTSINARKGEKREFVIRRSSH